MAPSRGSRKVIIVSDEEDDHLDFDVPLSDVEYTPKKAKAASESPLKKLKDSPRKPSRATSSAKSSPQKKGGSKSGSTGLKQENDKGKGTIFSFFNAATARQQAESDKTNGKSTPPVPSQAKPELVEDDSIVDGDVIEDLPVLNGSRTALAARKRKQNDVMHLIDPKTTGISPGSQKFVRLNSGGKSAATKVVDQRPWTERYGPVDLNELAVHKKKVADVRALLEDAVSSRSRPRLVVLNGPAGTGKTTTMRLLAQDLGLEIREWRNPSDIDISSASYTNTSAQFEDFIFRGGSFGGLELSTDNTLSNENHAFVRTDSSSSVTRNVILIEDFPVNLSPSSTILKNFRSTILAYISAPRSASRFMAPIFIVLSETLLSSSSSSEGITSHRLLGQALLKHPMTASIEFKPIAQTFLSKALALVAVKEARMSGRKRTPGLAIMSQLAEMGDVRSAVSALEFLCVRGDEGDSWSSKIAFTKPKGKTAAKSNGVKAEDQMTEQERQALKIVAGRENALGLWHGVGKVIYNKRIDVTIPELGSRPIKLPENDPEQLLLDLSTDLPTFVATVHENFVPSCSTGSSEQTLEALDGCLGALSDADIFGVERFGPGFGRGSVLEELRQEEMAFHTAIRGVVVSLPYPVNRNLGTASASRSRLPVISGPRSKWLWRGQEEIEELAYLCLEDYRKVLSTAMESEDGEPEANQTESAAWMPSASSKSTMILDQAPYMRLVQAAKGSTSSLVEKVRDLSRMKTRQPSGLASAMSGPGEDEEEELESAERSASRTRRTRTGKQDQQSHIAGLDVEEEVKGLVLSDDDIEDD